MLTDPLNPKMVTARDLRIGPVLLIRCTDRGRLPHTEGCVCPRHTVAPAAGRRWCGTPRTAPTCLPHSPVAISGAAFPNTTSPPALATGHHVTGPGPYETLVRTGEVVGRPVLRCTGPHRAAEAEPAAPHGRFLLMLIQGLAEAHGWAAAQAAAYLCSLPGATGTWTSAQVMALHEQNPYAIGAFVNRGEFGAHV